MTIRESVFFVYDGINSQDKGIYNVSLSGGLYSEPFLFDRSINEIKVRHRDKPYFQSVDKAPLAFDLTFYFEDTWDDNKIRETARWLNQDYYKPLYFSDNPDRIFYCMAVGQATLVHNGLKQGYVTLTMRCDSPYSYSSFKTSPIYTANATGINTTITNDGDTIIYPEIWITKKVANGNVSIVNTSNGNQTFQFTNIALNETIYIDCENEYIETNLLHLYRYDNFNNNYLKLIRGNNVLNIVGDCQVQFKYRYKLLQ